MPRSSMLRSKWSVRILLHSRPGLLDPELRQPDPPMAAHGVFLVARERARRRRRSAERRAGFGDGMARRPPLKAHRCRDPRRQGHGRFADECSVAPAKPTRALTRAYSCLKQGDLLMGMRCPGE